MVQAEHSIVAGAVEGDPGVHSSLARGAGQAAHSTAVEAGDTVHEVAHPIVQVEAAAAAASLAVGLAEVPIAAAAAAEGIAAEAGDTRSRLEGAATRRDCVAEVRTTFDE